MHGACKSAGPRLVELISAFSETPNSSNRARIRHFSPRRPPNGRSRPSESCRIGSLPADPPGADLRICRIWFPARRIAGTEPPNRPRGHPIARTRTHDAYLSEIGRTSHLPVQTSGPGPDPRPLRPRDGSRQEVEAGRGLAPPHAGRPGDAGPTTRRRFLAKLPWSGS